MHYRRNLSIFLITGTLLLVAGTPSALGIQLVCSQLEPLKTPAGIPLPTADRHSVAIDSNWIVYNKEEPSIGASTLWLYNRAQKTETPLRAQQSQRQLVRDRSPQIHDGFLTFLSAASPTAPSQLFLTDLNLPGSPLVLLDEEASPNPVQLSRPRLDFDSFTGRTYIAWGRDFLSPSPQQRSYRSCYITPRPAGGGGATGSCFTTTGSPSRNFHIDKIVDLWPGFPTPIQAPQMTSDPIPLFLPASILANGIAFTTAPVGIPGSALFISTQVGDAFWKGGYQETWSALDAHSGTVLLSVTDQRSTRAISIGLALPFRLNVLTASVAQRTFTSAHISRAPSYISGQLMALGYQDGALTPEVLAVHVGGTGIFQTSLTSPISGQYLSSPTTYGDVIAAQSQPINGLPGQRSVLTSTCYAR